MTELARLLDSDEGALRERVAQKLRDLDGLPVTVDYFTYWYTSRPPLHEAVLLHR